VTQGDRKRFKFMVTAWKGQRKPKDSWINSSLGPSSIGTANLESHTVDKTGGPGWAKLGHHFQLKAYCG
jgi:hypothetical protein